MLIINPSMSYGPTFKLFDIYPGPGSNTERDRIIHPLHTHAARPPQAKETNLWSLVLWLLLHSLLWPHWEWLAGKRCHLSQMQNRGHSSHWFTGHPFYVEVKPCLVPIQPTPVHSCKIPLLTKIVKIQLKLKKHSELKLKLNSYFFLN